MLYSHRRVSPFSFRFAANRDPDSRFQAESGIGGFPDSRFPAKSLLGISGSGQVRSGILLGQTVLNQGYLGVSGSIRNQDQGWGYQGSIREPGPTGHPGYLRDIRDQDQGWGYHSA
jgi:hypothetical protein